MTQDSSGHSEPHACCKHDHNHDHDHACDGCECDLSELLAASGASGGGGGKPSTGAGLFFFGLFIAIALILAAWIASGTVERIKVRDNTISPHAQIRKTSFKQTV